MNSTTKVPEMTDPLQLEGFRTPNFGDEVRQRRSIAQEPPSPGATPRDDLLPPRQTRTRSITPTDQTLTNFWLDVGESKDSGTNIQKLHVSGTSQDRSMPQASRVPTRRSTVDTVVRFGSSFVGGAYEPPRIPDPEIVPPTPPIAPDHPETLSTDFMSLLTDGINQEATRSIPTEELIDKVLEQFPPRARLPVQVMDFYEDRAERKLIFLANIEEAMEPRSKPADAVVRWIHAPLGVGLFHSSVEDIFLQGRGRAIDGHWRRRSEMRRGKDFVNAGRAGWPFLETEILNMRSTKQMQEARTTACALFEDEYAQKILRSKVFQGDCNQTLVPDVKWRSDHLGRGQNPQYWDTIYSDLPLLLSDGALIMKSPAATKQQPSLNMSAQTLQDDPSYKDAYLARDSFRCFHRSDGFLLTMSPSTGIDYLDRHLPNITKHPSGPVNSWRSEKSLQEEDEADLEFPNCTLSVIAHVFAEFEGDGTSRWQYQNAEWLMVFLMTEIACTPHSMRSGYSIATILDAYDAQVSKLIEKKFEPWARNETSRLFQSYLKTIDELRTLGKIYEKKFDFLKRLNADCVALQHEFASEGTRGRVDMPVITMTERVRFASRAVSDLVVQCRELHTDLTSSLDLMSRLRSIEQADLSISADSQGRAILVLSTVTMLFLPLSFLASIFSMNVQGIADNPPPMTLKHFCMICGITTLVVVSLVSIFFWRVRAGNNARALARIFGLGHDKHEAI